MESYNVIWKQIQDKMKKWKKEKSRNSGNLRKLEKNQLTIVFKLGNYTCNIHEQAMIAALDHGQGDQTLCFVLSSGCKMTVP